MLYHYLDKFIFTVNTWHRYRLPNGPVCCICIIQGRHMQHLAELLSPELENTRKKEEKMVKELEQVEQEGKPTGCS